MNKYKLYIWTDIIQDYSPGIALSIAKNKKEAIDLLLLEYDHTVQAYKKKLDRKSDFGAVHYEYYTKELFEKELKKKKPIVLNFNTPFALFQGGGS